MFESAQHGILCLLGLGFVVVLCPAAHGAVPARSPVPISVAFRGGTRRGLEAREVYGVVELSLPIDSLPKTGRPMRSRAVSDNASKGTGAGDPDAGQASPEPDATEPRAEPGREGGASAPAALEAPRSVLDPLPRNALLDRRLIQGCVARALRGVTRGGVGARLDGYGSRARWAAALPELRLRGGRSSDSSLRLAPTVDDPYRYTQSDGADLFFEVDLRWRLDRLVYDSDELAVERLRSQYSSAQAKRIQEVLGRLADWQTNAVRFVDSSLAPKGRIEAWIRMSIAGFWLDAYTGGWFGDAVEHRIKALSARASAD